MSWKHVFGFILICFLFISAVYSQEQSLQSYLEKSSSTGYELSKREKTELLNRIENVLEQAKEIQLKLARTVQGGEADVNYREGQFWMSRLEEDQRSIDSGVRELKTLRQKPADLVSAIKLYKSLKDVSFHFNSYNNLPLFSVSIGDLAPELELWADPIFYGLYLLPLARLRSLEENAPSKLKRQDGKGKRSERRGPIARSDRP